MTSWLSCLTPGEAVLFAVSFGVFCAFVVALILAIRFHHVDTMDLPISEDELKLRRARRGFITATKPSEKLMGLEK